MKMYFKAFYMLLVTCHVVVGKLLPNSNNRIKLKDGEIRFEENLAMNSSQSTEEDGYYSVDQDHGVSHVCIYEHWLQNELIICDRHQTHIFACIGAIEGEIKLCKKSTQKEIFVPVCVIEKTSQIITCNYKEIISRQLCFPRASSSKNVNKTTISSNALSHIAFRVCKNEKRFSCLKNGDITLCNNPGVGEKAPELKITESEYENSCNSSTPGYNCLRSDDHKLTDKPIKSRKKQGDRDGRINSRNKGKNRQVNGTTTVKQRKSKENKNSTTQSTKRKRKRTNKTEHKKATVAHRRNRKSTTRKPKYHKESSSDKNKRKRARKVLKTRNYKMMPDNYSQGKHKKNTSKHKYLNLKSIDVANEEEALQEIANDPFTTGSPKENMNNYFHVLKCDDCSIDHVIKVEEDAYNVKMWTLPTN